jgi:hypothetical protein
VLDVRSNVKVVSLPTRQSRLPVVCSCAPPVNSKVVLYILPTSWNLTMDVYELVIITSQLHSAPKFGGPSRGFLKKRFTSLIIGSVLSPSFVSSKPAGEDYHDQMYV